MARRRAIDGCIFCAPEPCTCGTIEPPKPANVKRMRKTLENVLTLPAEPEAEPEPVAVPDPEPTPAPRRASGARAAMRAHAAKPPTVTKAPTLVAAPQKVQAVAPVAASDPIMDDAIRACADIIHPAEKRTHADVLWTNSPTAARAAAWRAKRRNQ